MLDEDGPLDDPQDIEDVLRLYSLAELRVAQSRPREALEAALAVGEIGERTVGFLGYCPWRGVAVQSLLLLGERERACDIAGEELARASGPMCSTCGSGPSLCRPGRAGHEGRSPPPGGGAARRRRAATPGDDAGAGRPRRGPRRENRRSEAREPLERAADMARRGGLLALAERARIELAAAGARPRREALLTGPASLTPSERRIAELAATGQSNREIAQALFVTPKTVEYHLRNAYRKLDIQTRRRAGRRARIKRTRAGCLRTGPGEPPGLL